MSIKKEIKKIVGYLKKKGYVVTEGSTSPQELNYLIGLVRRYNVRFIGETGFNAGFSSYAFLGAKPNAKVISFDTGDHPYTKTAKAFVDRKFPGRHTLIYGDSKKTISQFKKKHPHAHFDLVFIDGGHDYVVAKSDITNFRLLCDKDSLIVIDDLTPWFNWGKGPTRAWKEALRKKFIVQKEMFKDGKRITKIKPPGTRAWALGHYLYKRRK